MDMSSKIPQSPSRGIILTHLCSFVFLLATGAEGRRLAGAGLSKSEDSLFSQRHGGFPKFPLPDFTPELNCGLRISARIINGTKEQYGTHPWQAQIEVYERSSFKHLCGGAIISDLHILTAAHCLQKPLKGMGDYRVKVGNFDQNRVDKGEQMFEIENWRIHHSFRQGSKYSNDIAILKLKAQQGRKIQMSRFVSPVCLPSSATNFAVGEMCEVSGWGQTIPDYELSASKTLLTAKVPLMADEQCRSLLRSQGYTEGMICAGYMGGQIDACRGDSGGPLTCHVDGKHTLLGLVSWGERCGRPRLPGVYTEVKYYLDWILTAMEDM